MLDLDKRSITYLPGVGPKKADILQKEAGISLICWRGKL